MDRHEELGSFLRNSRLRLASEQPGTPTVLPGRPTPGQALIALLAGIGAARYALIEDGLVAQVSEGELEALGRVLNLEDSDREMLFRIAGQVRPARVPQDVTRIAGPLKRVLDAMLPSPAYLIDRHWNLLAVNDTARKAFGYDERDYNCLVSFFLNPEHRAAFRRIDTVAPGIVARFRADAQHHPDDEVFGRLVGDLATASEEFAELWKRSEALEEEDGIRVLTHPDTGDLVLEYTTLLLPNRPGDRLIVHTPKPGTGTRERLALLAGPIS